MVVGRALLAVGVLGAIIVCQECGTRAVGVVVVMVVRPAAAVQGVLGRVLRRRLVTRGGVFDDFLKTRTTTANIIVVVVVFDKCVIGRPVRKWRSLWRGAATG